MLLNTLHRINRLSSSIKSCQWWWFVLSSKHGKTSVVFCIEELIEINSQKYIDVKSFSFVQCYSSQSTVLESTVETNSQGSVWTPSILELETSQNLFKRQVLDSFLEVCGVSPVIKKTSYNFVAKLFTTNKLRLH